MPRSKATPASSKKTKIFCRICGPETQKINRQSYKDHLKLIHNDTSGDLREWGQPKLNLFGAKRHLPADNVSDGHEIPVEEERGEDDTVGEDDPVGEEDDTVGEDDPFGEEDYPVGEEDDPVWEEDPVDMGTTVGYIFQDLGILIF